MALAWALHKSIELHQNIQLWQKPNLKTVNEHVNVLNWMRWKLTYKLKYVTGVFITRNAFPC